MRQVRGRLDLAVQPVERLTQRLDEVAADGFVDAVDDLRIGVERDELEGRRSRVDAEEQGARRLVDALALELGLAMARAKRRELVGVLEQRRQKREVALELAHGGDAPLELGRVHDDGIAAESPRVIRKQRRARDGEQMRVLRLGAIACRKPERPAKRVDEVRHVLERTAQEDDVATDGAPAGKPR